MRHAHAAAETGRGVLAGERRPTRTIPAGNEIDAADQGEHLVIRMAQSTVHRLQSQATRKGISESALAVVLLETIDRDDLYEAVLDDEANTKTDCIGSTPDPTKQVA
jgi:hypothetical protein